MSLEYKFLLGNKIEYFKEKTDEELLAILKDAVGNYLVEINENSLLETLLEYNKIKCFKFMVENKPFQEKMIISNINSALTSFRNKDINIDTLEFLSKFAQEKQFELDVSKLYGSKHIDVNEFILKNMNINTFLSISYDEYHTKKIKYNDYIKNIFKDDVDFMYEAIKLKINKTNDPMAIIELMNVNEKLSDMLSKEEVEKILYYSQFKSDAIFETLSKCKNFDVNSEEIDKMIFKAKHNILKQLLSLGYDFNKEIITNYGKIVSGEILKESIKIGEYDTFMFLIKMGFKLDKNDSSINTHHLFKEFKKYYDDFHSKLNDPDVESTLKENLLRIKELNLKISDLNETIVSESFINFNQKDKAKEIQELNKEITLLSVRNNTIISFFGELVELKVAKENGQKIIDEIKAKEIESRSI